MLLQVAPDRCVGDTYTPEAMHSSSRSMPRSTIWLLEVPCGYMKLGVLSATPRAATGHSKCV